MERWRYVNAIYQIYPRSFKDANGDGVGDLRGIIDKLDYIKGGEDSLGIDAIWLSPFYKSPMADFGYDISDHYDVDPLFGTIEDYRALLDAAHARDIKVMIDFVPNHTSDQHKWFIESRQSRDNPKRDWYVWRDPQPDGSPPNNWLSVFGGSAWTFDSTRKQYYLHSFLAEQPDLNWEHPDVRRAMRDVMAYWLGLGTDGIRIDAVRWISKDVLLRDNPINPDYDEKVYPNPYASQIQLYSRFGPRLFEYLQEIILDGEFEDRIFVFEDYTDVNKMSMSSNSQHRLFYSQVNSKVAMPFNFDGMFIQWGANNFRTFVSEFQQSLEVGFIPAYCFGNHDQPRLASRFNLDKARVIAMLELTLPGLPVVYYGDEIGMLDIEIPPDKVQDPREKQNSGHGLGRDPERTPMQWADEQNAGFSTVSPWLPLPGDLKGKTVADQLKSTDSFLTLYRKLLQLRREYTCLRRGEFRLIDGNNDNIFAYACKNKLAECRVVLNFSDNEATYLTDFNFTRSLSTGSKEVTIHDGQIHLQPHEGILLISQNF